MAVEHQVIARAKPGNDVFVDIQGPALEPGVQEDPQPLVPAGAEFDVGEEVGKVRGGADDDLLAPGALHRADEVASAGFRKVHDLQRVVPGLPSGPDGRRLVEVDRAAHLDEVADLREVRDTRDVRGDWDAGAGRKQDCSRAQAEGRNDRRSAGRSCHSPALEPRSAGRVKAISHLGSGSPHFLRAGCPC